jgi:hypothetical protein
MCMATQKARQHEGAPSPWKTTRIPSSRPYLCWHASDFSYLRLDVTNDQSNEVGGWSSTKMLLPWFHLPEIILTTCAAICLCSHELFDITSIAGLMTSLSVIKCTVCAIIYQWSWIIWDHTHWNIDDITHVCYLLLAIIWIIRAATNQFLGYKI